MIRQITDQRSESLIRARARALQLPVPQLRDQARSGGLITASGYLTYCGNRYVLRRACRCVRHCTPTLNCPACRGTGQA